VSELERAPDGAPALKENAMTTALEGSESDAVSTHDSIPTLRGQIDALDEAIIRLVAERTRLSKRVQAARINAGGARIELGRERMILDADRSALGSDGPQLADAVLRVGRGAL
jgi:chorismate mutase